MMFLIFKVLNYNNSHCILLLIASQNHKTALLYSKREILSSLCTTSPLIMSEESWLIHLVDLT